MKKFMLPAEKQSWKKRIVMGYVAATLLSTLFASASLATTALVVAVIVALGLALLVRNKPWPDSTAWYAGVLPLAFASAYVGLSFLTDPVLSFPYLLGFASVLWHMDQDSYGVFNRIAREVGDMLLGYPDSQADHVWQPGTSLKVRRWYYRVMLVMLLLVSLSPLLLDNNI